MKNFLIILKYEIDKEIINSEYLIYHFLSYKKDVKVDFWDIYKLLEQKISKLSKNEDILIYYNPIYSHFFI